MHLLYPSLNEIQGVCRNADGNECSVADFVKMKCGEIGEKDIALHPSSTHLVFYDMSGTRKGGGQNLPWTEVDKLHDYLNKKEGVAEGCLLCNGDHTDLPRRPRRDRRAHARARSARGVVWRVRMQPPR